MVSIKNQEDLLEEFIPLKTQDFGIQQTPLMSAHEVNTETIEFASSGMAHTEGGWPKDVSINEEDQKLRYRKKIEKDETYIHSVLQLGAKVEHCIRQNNAINIYESYFRGEEAPIAEDPQPVKTVNVIRDPRGGSKRMVTSITFSPEGGRKVAVAYASTKFMGLPEGTPKESYVWDINTSSSPEVSLQAPSWLQCIQYNAKDANVIAGGLHNGQLAWWDVRQGGTVVEATPLSASHTQVVTGLRWLAHKTRCELFSVSTDGQVMWWDTRKLSTPTDVLVLDVTRSDPPNHRRALSGLAVEYEASMPTKFMVATEQGLVLACNRRARTPPERLGLIYKAHIAPVYATQRNPFFLKNFMTVGDWTVKLWAEDFRESAILWTPPSPAQLRGGCWSPTRSSVLFAVRTDGALDAWDLLSSWGAPTYTAQVVDEVLETVSPHEGGQLLATGSQLGTVSLLQLPWRLVAPSDRHEKAGFTALLERETRRERVLEARHKEQRLKERVRGAGAAGRGGGRGGPARRGGGRPSIGARPGGLLAKTLGGAAGAKSKGSLSSGGGSSAAEEPKDPIIQAEEDYWKAVQEVSQPFPVYGLHDFYIVSILETLYRQSYGPDAHNIMFGG
ncbi:dynein intermediate chain 3, ciliary-like [Oratosquilla oratoria]|uniref:dynein intermediate chain 3, ciliary-like n=1 Tax=Oratosquilla oratoria TaxID=337810 RepID=UPI003F75EB69